MTSRRRGPRNRPTGRGGDPAVPIPTTVRRCSTRWTRANSAGWTYASRRVAARRSISGNRLTLAGGAAPGQGRRRRTGRGPTCPLGIPTCCRRFPAARKAEKITRATAGPTCRRRRSRSRRPSGRSSRCHRRAGPGRAGTCPRVIGPPTIRRRRRPPYRFPGLRRPPIHRPTTAAIHRHPSAGTDWGRRRSNGPSRCRRSRVRRHGRQLTTRFHPLPTDRGNRQRARASPVRTIVRPKQAPDGRTIPRPPRLRHNNAAAALPWSRACRRVRPCQWAAQPCHQRPALRPRISSVPVNPARPAVPVPLTASTMPSSPPGGLRPACSCPGGRGNWTTSGPAGVLSAYPCRRPRRNGRRLSIPRNRRRHQDRRRPPPCPAGPGTGSRTFPPSVGASPTRSTRHAPARPRVPLARQLSRSVLRPMPPTRRYCRSGFLRSRTYQPCRSRLWTPPPKHRNLLASLRTCAGPTPRCRASVPRAST